MLAELVDHVIGVDPDRDRSTVARTRLANVGGDHHRPLSGHP
jgi:hypothetical protein